MPSLQEGTPAFARPDPFVPGALSSTGKLSAAEVSLDTGSVADRLEEVQRAVEALRMTLLPGEGGAPGPEAIANHTEALERAASILQGLTCGSELTRDPAAIGELRARFRSLQREIQRAARLIGHAAVMNAGWARVLAVASGGYTPAGEPAVLEARGTLAVDG